MRRIDTVTHQFVDAIPGSLADGTLYVSIEYATAVHKCFCGCGQEVVTPLSPTDWKLVYDGETVSLDPSVGNWSFDCQSHYWIKRGKVRWAEQWSAWRIQAARKHDLRSKENYYGPTKPTQRTSPMAKPKTGIFAWLRGLLK